MRPSSGSDSINCQKCIRKKIPGYIHGEKSDCIPKSCRKNQEIRSKIPSGMSVSPDPSGLSFVATVALVLSEDARAGTVFVAGGTVGAFVKPGAEVTGISAAVGPCGGVGATGDMAPMVAGAVITEKVRDCRGVSCGGEDGVRYFPIFHCEPDSQSAYIVPDGSMATLIVLPRISQAPRNSPAGLNLWSREV